MLSCDLPCGLVSSTTDQDLASFQCPEPSQACLRVDELEGQVVFSQQSQVADHQISRAKVLWLRGPEELPAATILQLFQIPSE